MTNERFVVIYGNMKDHGINLRACHALNRQCFPLLCMIYALLHAHADFSCFRRHFQHLILFKKKKVFIPEAVTSSALEHLAVSAAVNQN